jgi:hypothetical protein
VPGPRVTDTLSFLQACHFLPRFSWSQFLSAPDRLTLFDEETCRGFLYPHWCTGVDIFFISHLELFPIVMEGYGEMTWKGGARVACLGSRWSIPCSMAWSGAGPIIRFARVGPARSWIYRRTSLSRWGPTRKSAKCRSARKILFKPYPGDLLPVDPRGADPINCPPPGPPCPRCRPTCTSPATILLTPAKDLPRMVHLAQSPNPVCSCRSVPTFDPERIHGMSMHLAS